MSCAVQYEDSALLNVTFTENEWKKDFVVHFKPDEGQQRKVVSCEWIQTREDYECSIIESGLTQFFPLCKNIPITLPESLQNSPGRFRCQILGENTTDLRWCSWNPSEMPSTPFPGDETFSASNSDNFGTGDAGNFTAVAAGVAGGVLLIIVIFLMACSLLSKKGNSKQSAAYSRESKDTKEDSKGEVPFVKGNRSFQMKDVKDGGTDPSSHKFTDIKCQRSAPDLLSSDPDSSV